MSRTVEYRCDHCGKVIANAKDDDDDSAEPVILSLHRIFHSDDEECVSFHLELCDPCADYARLLLLPLSAGMGKDDSDTDARFTAAHERLMASSNTHDVLAAIKDGPSER